MKFAFIKNASAYVVHFCTCKHRFYMEGAFELKPLQKKESALNKAFIMEGWLL